MDAADGEHFRHRFQLARVTSVERSRGQLHARVLTHERQVPGHQRDQEGGSGDRSVDGSEVRTP